MATRKYHNRYITRYNSLLEPGFGEQSEQSIDLNNGDSPAEAAIRGLEEVDNHEESSELNEDSLSQMVNSTPNRTPIPTV